MVCVCVVGWGGGGAIGVEGGSCVTQQVLSGGGDDPSDNLATSGHLAFVRTSHDRASEYKHTRTDRQFCSALQCQLRHPSWKTPCAIQADQSAWTVSYPWWDGAL